MPSGLHPLTEADHCESGHDRPGLKVVASVTDRGEFELLTFGDETLIHQ